MWKMTMKKRSKKRSKGTLYVFSGPSGVGKDTVLSLLLTRSDLVKSVSATTRAPREGEVDGVDYYFVSKEEFERLIETGEMLEYTVYAGNYYGTPKAPVERWLSEGSDVILKIEVDGFSQIKKLMPESVGIFLLPPSKEELERRLRARGTDSEEAVLRRLETALNELSCAENYDWRVVNDDLDLCVDEILAFLKKQKKNSR